MQAADSFIDLVQEKSADNAELYPTFVACINDYNQGRYERGSTSISARHPRARTHEACMRTARAPRLAPRSLSPLRFNWCSLTTDQVLAKMKTVFGAQPDLLRKFQGCLSSVQKQVGVGHNGAASNNNGPSKPKQSRLGKRVLSDSGGELAAEGAITDGRAVSPASKARSSSPRPGSKGSRAEQSGKSQSFLSATIMVLCTHASTSRRLH